MNYYPWLIQLGCTGGGATGGSADRRLGGVCGTLYTPPSATPPLAAPILQHPYLDWVALVPGTLVLAFIERVHPFSTRTHLLDMKQAAQGAIVIAQELSKPPCSLPFPSFPFLSPLRPPAGRLRRRLFFFLFATGVKKTPFIPGLRSSLHYLPHS